jgi:predicted ATPase
MVVQRWLWQLRIVLEARVVTGNAIRHPSDESYRRLRIMPEASAGSVALGGGLGSAKSGPPWQWRMLIELLVRPHILAQGHVGSAWKSRRRHQIPAHKCERDGMPWLHAAASISGNHKGQKATVSRERLFAIKISMVNKSKPNPSLEISLDSPNWFRTRRITSSPLRLYRAAPNRGINSDEVRGCAVSSPLGHHFERALMLYDPAKHDLHAYTYGQDPAVVCLIHAGWDLWLLGYPDQALKRNDEGFALAQRLLHPASLATAAAFAGWLQQFCRNVQEVKQLAEIAVDLSNQHDFAFSKAIGIILGGWALTRSGQRDAGIVRMRSGLEVLRTTDAVTMMGYFSSLLAEAYGEAGQADEGLSVLAGVDNSHEKYWEAELNRIKGELMLGRASARSQREDDRGDAEECFREALTISRAQKAKSLELRAAMSLFRLRLRQGRRSEARLELEEIYGWFTEGYETPDLRDAKMLLEELQPN